MALFPAPRRLVTGHDEKGKAVYLKDHTIEPEATNMDASFAVLWETHEFPANNNGFKDPIETKTESLSNKDGVVLRVVDIPANTVTPFHRTVSLDFGIVLEGEVECYLDDGVTKRMKRGDVCVQRGTIHGWKNPTDQPARIYFVLIAAGPVEIDGKPFEKTGFSDKEVTTGGK
ncbi:Cupin RmlC-type [Lasiodiplodia theobromae]|nr:Cupin RmlC-type [Lasiodiplodia theobromae]